MDDPQYTEFVYDRDRRLEQVRDQTGRVLLDYRYDEDGYLAEVVDPLGRKVVYTFGAVEDYGYDEAVTLLSVSQLVATDAVDPPMRWQYGYDAATPLGNYPYEYGPGDECPYDGDYGLGVDSYGDETPSIDTALLMTSITVPSPTGEGASTATIEYGVDTYAVSATTDANGNRTTYLRESFKTTVATYEPDGTLLKSYEVTYNANGQETSSTCAGCPTTIAYDDPNNPFQPTSITAADGKVTSFTYDSHGNLLTTTDPRGVTITNTFSYAAFPLGRLMKVERTVDTTTITIAEYTYNEPSGYLATAKSLKPGTTSAELVTTSYTYDELGNMLTVTTPGNDAASTITTTFGYETDGSYSQDAAVGQPLYVEDALGNRTHFRYDQFGRRVRVIDALGHGNRTYYNLAGQVIRVNQGGDIDGATSPILTLVAEKVGNPPNLLSATASAMLRLPDATNPDVLVRPLTALPAFQATPFSADVLAFSLPVSTSGSYIVEEVNVSLVGAAGTWDESNYWKLTLQTRDEALEVVSEVSGETFATAGAALVTLLGVADSGTVYTYLYPGGPTLRQEVVDRNGDALQTIEYSSGAEGELLAVSGGTEPVAYTYNALYQQTSLTDGNEQTTLFAFDSKNRPSLIRYPGASADEGYDTIRFTLYDDAGRLLRRIDGRDIVTEYEYDDPGGLLTAITYTGYSSQDVAFTYDDLGRRETMADAEGSHSYTYDDGGRMLSHAVTYTGLAAKTVSYTYYPNGSRDTLTHPGDTLSYGYDAAGRMISLDYGLGTAAWEYLANGLLAKQTLPNDAYTDYSYNPANELNGLANRNPSGELLAGYGEFGYLGTGDLATVTSTIPDATSLQGVVDYSYDAKRQLTKEASDRVSGYSYANAFDGAGNATTFRNDPHSYNDDNQLTGPATYVYDGNGNPTTFGGTSLSFDVENRMTGYGTALTAGYRGDGLRAWKQPGGGNKTYFLYDGISVLCELDDTGAVSASSTYGANGLLSRGTAQYQFDPLGDAVLLLDGSGDLTATQGFDAWGNALVTATGPFGYRARYGYFADSETGLVALAYRYYAPGVGRFLNRDPVVHRGGVNVYCYVRNSPLGRTDTTGLEPPSIERPRPRPGPNPLDGVYGRYCGPQFVPGVGDPVDGLDACCKGHDDCFSQHGCNVLNQTCRRWCRLCTEALCNCFNDPRRCDDAADREMCKSMQRLFKMLYCNFVFEGVF